MSSNIKEILTRITGKTYGEEDIYDQNESTDIPSFYSDNTSSINFSSQSIWSAREANPSHMSEENKIIKNNKKKDLIILSLFRAPKTTSKKQIFQLETRWWYNSFKYPKKEYLRCKLIRLHKKVNRQIQQGKNPFEFVSNDESLEIWKKLKEIYESSRNLFCNLSATNNEPQYHGKHKSFNNEFCAGYFKEQVTRESFYYFTELLFCKFEPTVLIKSFQLWCCPNENEHNLLCSEKWYLLKKWINNLMIADLGVEPWFPKGNNENQITDEELKEIMKINKKSEVDKHKSELQFRDEILSFGEVDEFLSNCYEIN
ncbi:unnamed protein product [Blepharisma stoltei]|uniref:Uncharacterized protein n=1 Tax=Blepharisma stoltei TaxID=1481888 RepID=A0AAU9IBC1_9CILI|nr:unnamed protein product [Blepharisma stoltei]